MRQTTDGETTASHDATSARDEVGPHLEIDGEVLVEEVSIDGMCGVY